MGYGTGALWDLWAWSIGETTCELYIIMSDLWDITHQTNQTTQKDVLFPELDANKECQMLISPNVTL